MKEQPKNNSRMPHLLEVYIRAYAKTKPKDHEVHHTVKWIDENIGPEVQ